MADSGHLFVSIGALIIQAQVPSSPVSAPVSLAGTESIGSPESPITIMVFSDFESFPCARFASVPSGVLAGHREAQVMAII
jgi:hypothetical protein